MLREREYLAAILARERLLRAQTLRFAEEIRSRDALDLSRSTRLPAADRMAVLQRSLVARKPARRAGRAR